ncbi:radical SAM family protein [Oscillospiraceae bacterium]|nr:radical SAM family protein [Oscillospiraceae bacterium]
MICAQCPRACGAERGEDRPGGVCAMPAEAVVARAALHFWEEPPISGTRGSGTVFFSGCNLRCVFCQNSVISQEGFGKAVTVERLREIFWALIGQGAHNINLVTPTHFAHAVARALEEPLPVPVVWNTGGYESVETLRGLEGKVQVYLPDLKYLDPARAERYSAAPDYPERAKAAILEMFRQTGPCVFDGEGLLKRGLVIRHLLLPGGLPEAKAVMDWVAGTFPPGEVRFSLMSQYVPLGRAGEYPEIDRKLRASERRSAEEYMAALELAGYAQDPEAASGDYVPDFDLTGV